MRKPFLLAPLLTLASCGHGAEGPSILLVTFDTTRADHLSCYGYPKKTSPRIDQLAADALRFENAYSVSSWTLPAHASLFTGKFPSAHGARYNPEGKINLVMEGGIKGNPAWNQYRANTIAKTEITLARILTERGYATHAIIGGPWMKAVFGLDEGFESYDDSNFVLQQGSELNGRTAEDITDHAIAFVDAHAGEPFFLFLNYYDPHSPYTPAPEYLARFWSGPLPARGQQSWEFNNARYDAEIRYTDEHFGRLLDHLRAKRLYEDMWIVFTADHGELMGEQDDEGTPMGGHGDSLSQAEVHIPLIVKEPGPGRPRGVSDVFVQQVDVMPTLLDRLGLPHPPNLQGRSFDDPRAEIVAEVYPLPFMNAGKPWRQQGDWKAIVEGPWKFVWGGRGRHLLFDLEADPGELENLVDARPDVAQRLEEKLIAYFAALPRPGEAMEVETTQEDLDLLKGVGYLGGEEQ